MTNVEALSGGKQEETQSFRLPITQREVGVTTGRRKDHPVFAYHIKAGEWHRVGNLEFSGEPCLETQSVELTFREVESSDPQISLGELEIEGDILFMGSQGSAAARKIKDEGIVMLQMSMSRDVRIVMMSPKSPQPQIE